MRVGGIRQPICRTKSVVKLSEHCYSGIIQHGHDTHTQHTRAHTHAHTHIHVHIHVRYVDNTGIRQNATQCCKMFFENSIFDKIR